MPERQPPQTRGRKDVLYKTSALMTYGSPAVRDADLRRSHAFNDETPLTNPAFHPPRLLATTYPSVTCSTEPHPQPPTRN